MFNTILALGFNSLRRPGELVEPDRQDLKDDRKPIKCWTLKIIGDEEYELYSLPCSKTDTEFSGTTVIIPARTGSVACPLPTLMRYVVIRDSAFPTNPSLLLRFNGYIPTRNWFMKRLHKVFGKKISGPSPRAGGATAFAQSGVRMEVTQRMNRWKSDAFESYIHAHPLLNLLASQQEACSHKLSTGSNANSSYLKGNLIILG